MTRIFHGAGDIGERQLVAHRRDSAADAAKPSVHGRYTSPPWPASE